MAIKLNGKETGAKVPAFVTRLPMSAGTHSLVNLIQHGLTKSNTRERAGRLHAGDAGFCERQAVLKSTAEGETIQPASMTAYCELGNSIEALVVDALYSTRAILFTQYRLPDIGLNLGGYVDGIICLDGKLRVLEVKSCGDLPKSPKPEHWSQAMIYSAVTGLPATIMYWSRDVAKFNGELLIQPFDLDEGIDENRRTVIYRAALAHAAVNLKQIPDIPSHLAKASDCGYCPFKDFCWRGEEIDSKLVKVTAESNLEISKIAKEFTDKFLTPEAIANRRIGILHYLEVHGNEFAKEILVNTAWDALI